MADVEAPVVPSVGTAVAEVAPPTTAAVDEPLQALPGEAPPETEIPSTEEAIEVQPEEEVNLDEVPESSGEFDKYKPLYKDHPDLRKIIGREQAFTEIAPNGSLQELRSIVERVPSVDDAETLASAAENLRAFGETYRNDPAGFTESLRENDPLAFSQLAKQLPQILAETDPSLYREQSVFYTNSTLDNLFARYQNSGNQDAILSIQNVASMLGVQLGAPRVQPNADNSEVAKLRRQLEERDRADVHAKAESFWDGANNEYVANTTGEIEALIKKSIPTVTDAQLKRMAGEVWEGVNSRLGAQPQTISQIERFKADVSKGKMGVSDHKAIVDFSTRRAKQLIPLVWKEVSAEWSKQVLAFNKQQIDKKTGIAARTREAAAPTATPGAPAAQSAQRPAGQKRTFKSVFDSLTKGTYRPSA